MKKEIINPPSQGKSVAAAPYSVAIKVTSPLSIIFLSGQTALDNTGQVVGVGDIEAQTRQAFENLKATLALCGASMKNVVKMNTYLTDINNLPIVRKIRKEYFDPDNPPTLGTALEIKSMSRREFLIELDVVAVTD